MLWDYNSTMDANYLFDLYRKTSPDEVVTPFNNEPGLSIIRPYPESTPYHTDGMRMFIKIANLERGLYYSVDMTKPENSEGDNQYVILSGKDYKKKVTNFYSDDN